MVALRRDRWGGQTEEGYSREQSSLAVRPPSLLSTQQKEPEVPLLGQSMRLVSIQRAQENVYYVLENMRQRSGLGHETLCADTVALCSLHSPVKCQFL